MITTTYVANSGSCLNSIFPDRPFDPARSIVFFCTTPDRTQSKEFRGNACYSFEDQIALADISCERAQCYDEGRAAPEILKLLQSGLGISGPGRSDTGVIDTGGQIVESNLPLQTTQIKTVIRCDDVNGDLSQIVPYVDAYAQTYDDENCAISTKYIGSFTDDTFTGEYEAQNPGDCNFAEGHAALQNGENLVRTEYELAETCQPLYICPGLPGVKFILNPETFLYEVIEVSESELNIPSSEGSKVFESEVLDFIAVFATTAEATVADVLAAVEAAGLPDLFCKETGQSTPATVGDICEYKVKRLPCKYQYLTDPADPASAVEVGPDDGYFVGGLSVNVAEDTYGAVDPDRVIAAGADAVTAWCFKLRRELNKAEIAAL